MKILFFGDIVGKPGREAISKILPELRQQHRPDLVAANAENLAHGKGVTFSTLQELLDAGVAFFTSGNHIFDNPEAMEVFAKWSDRIIRPANLVGENLPGKGYGGIEVNGRWVLFVNLLGRVFMEKQFDQGQITNPFLKLNEILSGPDAQTPLRILDFHSEATSEKRGMGFWADGRVSAVLGTHTHIPTADAQILPQGTGFVTDVGMVGAADSVIGMEREGALKRLVAEGELGEKVALTIPPVGRSEICYVVLEIDEASGRCQNINSFRLIR